MARHAARRRSLRLPDRLLAALSLGVVLGLGAVSTSAYWTDEATVAGGTFTTGTLDLKVGDPAVDNDPAEFTTSFAMQDMVPGSTKNASLKVSNVGNVPFTYTVTASATNSAAGQFGSAIRIRTSVGTCPGSEVQTFVAPSAVNINRPSLGGDTSETLCFTASLPADAPNSLQGQQTVVTFTLQAVQVP